MLRCENPHNFALAEFFSWFIRKGFNFSIPSKEMPKKHLVCFVKVHLKGISFTCFAIIAFSKCTNTNTKNGFLWLLQRLRNEKRFVINVNVEHDSKSLWISKSILSRKWGSSIKKRFHPPIRFSKTWPNSLHTSHQSVLFLKFDYLCHKCLSIISHETFQMLGIFDLIWFLFCQMERSPFILWLFNKLAKIKRNIRLRGERNRSQKDWIKFRWRDWEGKSNQ